jgi:hypothetical protein
MEAGRGGEEEEEEGRSGSCIQGVAAAEEGGGGFIYLFNLGIATKGSKLPLTYHRNECLKNSN